MSDLLQANLLVVLGGVGLFLLGMPLLTDGRRHFGRPSLRRVLVRFTNTTLKGTETAQPLALIGRYCSSRCIFVDVRQLHRTNGRA